MTAAGEWIKIEPDAPMPELIDVYPYGWKESTAVLVLTADNRATVAQWITYDPADGWPPYWRETGRDSYRLERVTHWAPIVLPCAEVRAIA